MHLGSSIEYNAMAIHIIERIIFLEIKKANIPIIKNGKVKYALAIKD